MFGSIGMPEMIIILVIALVVFGPGKLPEIGGAIGRGIKDFKRAMTDPEKKPEENPEVKRVKDEPRS
jgi:sec-independent protein translocase protein TatA